MGKYGDAGPNSVCVIHSIERRNAQRAKWAPSSVLCLPAAEKCRRQTDSKYVVGASDHV